MSTAQKVIKYFAIAFAMFLIINIISFILFLFYNFANVLKLGNSDSKENISGEVKEIYTMDIKDVSNLKMELGFSNLQIKEGDKFRVETNNSKVSISENNGSIVIKEKTNNWFSQNNNTSTLIVYIPKGDSILKEVNIEAGAGEINIEQLKTEKIDFEVGAGKVKIDNITVTKEATIEGGAGKTEILSGEMNNLDLDLGVGEFNLNSKLTGKNDIDAGIGAVKLDLTDDLDNYTIKASKGIGSIKLDGQDISGDTKYGTGESYIEIDGGIGSIEIK